MGLVRYSDRSVIKVVRVFSLIEYAFVIVDLNNRHLKKWQSQILTSLDFKWLKRDWVANGLDFEWDLKSGSSVRCLLHT